MLKKILVCLDGYKFAERIPPYAIERARRFNSKVVLLKVITVNSGAYSTHIPEQPPLIMPELLYDIIREEETRAKSYLGGIVTRLRKMGLDLDATILHETAEGTIGSTIATYAAANEVDLIIMATHGYSGWKRLVFGSVAECVMRESALPVLVVKPEDTKTDDGAFGRYEWV